MFEISPIEQYIPDKNMTIIARFFMGFSFIVIPFSIFGIVLAINFLKLKPWTRKVLEMLSWLSIILIFGDGIFAIVRFSSYQLMLWDGFFCIPFAIIIKYIRGNTVRNAFEVIVEPVAEPEVSAEQVITPVVIAESIPKPSRKARYIFPILLTLVFMFFLFYLRSFKLKEPKTHSMKADPRSQTEIVSGDHLTRGNSYFKKGDYDRAITEYNKAIEINPKYAWAYNSRGVAYSAKGQYDHGIADFNRAIEINPKYANAHRNRGCAYRAKGQYDHAIADYNKAIEIKPKFWAAYYNRGIAYRAKGQYDNAIADYNKAIEINPRSVDAYNNRGVAYSAKGQYDHAIADYNKGIEINPRSVDAYNNRGVAYYFKREYDKAWEDVHKVQSLGFQVHPGFLKDLRKASKRQK
jgi:tetratricopeptide (TPR) repeat protein